MQRRILFFKKKLRLSKLNSLNITKRQKFVIAVVFLSLGLFFAENLFGKSGFILTVLLSLVTDIVFIGILYKDIKGNFSIHVLLLPFLYTLAFGLFFFLVPARLISRIIMTFLYGVGLYSLFLSQNIFLVASIRTIALLAGARLVSFVITLVSYFFLCNIIFSLHENIGITGLLVFAVSFLLCYQSLWTITLESSLYKSVMWTCSLSIALLEATLMLWFWPTSPTVIAIFLTGLFYAIVGISQSWFDRRLFRGVLWEYIWVAVIVFFILMIFTSWKATSFFSF